MIVDRKDGKWRVTQMACGCHWRADLTEGKGVFAGKVISQQMNKDQFERWKGERVMEWIKCSESLPEANQQVLVNDLNGEGVLIAWRALWMGMGGIPTGDFQWVFQINGIDHEDVKIREWCAYPPPSE